jgi:plastocyanin
MAVVIGVTKVGARTKDPGGSKMKRSLLISAAIVALGTSSAAAFAGTPSTAQVMIRHQVRGCHTWSVNGGAWAASQSTRIARKGAIAFVNNDVMPHKLVQTRGPAVAFVGKPAMNHMGASVKVVFPKAGVYRFTTRAGEDYMSMPMMKTTGEDNVLRLTVTVP